MRIRLFEMGLKNGLVPLTMIHPTSMCSTTTVIGRGTHLLSGIIVNVAARIGQNLIVNSGEIIEHDCEIADHGHIAAEARLASTVKTGLGVHIGAGATAREGIQIGERSIAGAVVVKEVPPLTLVVGVPARPIKKFSL